VDLSIGCQLLQRLFNNPDIVGTHSYLAAIQAAISDSSQPEQPSDSRRRRGNLSTRSSRQRVERESPVRCLHSGSRMIRPAVTPAGTASASFRRAVAAAARRPCRFGRRLFAVGECVSRWSMTHRRWERPPRASHGPLFCYGFEIIPHLGRRAAIE
jgi:hypothetical protein